MVTAGAAEAGDAPDHDRELAGWPYLERVKGLRVVILGGEVREERRVALEEAFQTSPSSGSRPIVLGS